MVNKVYRVYRAIYTTHAYRHIGHIATYIWLMQAQGTQFIHRALHGIRGALQRTQSIGHNIVGNTEH
jgi:hypothetical protein